MKIIDTHCDALYKLQKAKKAGEIFPFQNEKQLQTNLQRLQAGNVFVQFFAIFLDPEVPSDEMWQDALQQIDLFHSEIIDKHREVKHITKWEQLNELKRGEIGAVLTLEGAEPIGNDLYKLRQLYDKGIMSIGLTWNYANLCADGVGEPRGAGLSLLGKEVVRLNNEHKVLTDVSHLSEKGFWEVIEDAAYPFASHSNAKAICNHQRNLDDEQIKSLIQKNAQIHLVFYPEFVKDTRRCVKIKPLINKIDNICSLGGKNNIGFGSDFDGIDYFVSKLEDASQYQNLIEMLLKYYTEEEVRGFAYENFLNFIKQF